MSWMDVTLLTTIKVSECKLGPFDHTQSMPKWPKGLGYVGTIINYLLYLPDPFPTGLEIDLKGSNTLLLFMLFMHIDRLSLVSHLYGC